MKYDDIIDMPHHVSEKHPQMDIRERAAQFAPFAALTGHGDAVFEAGRYTERYEYMCEDALCEIEYTFRELCSHKGEKRQVLIVYFEKDLKKEGGRYLSLRGYIKKADEIKREIIMENGEVICLKDIKEMEIV